MLRWVPSTQTLACLMTCLLLISLFEGQGYSASRVPAGYALTGTVTSNGEIGQAGSVPLKIQAARTAKLRRVVVSKQTSAVEHADNLPISIQISPVLSVQDALNALTDTSPINSAISEGEPR